MGLPGLNQYLARIIVLAQGHNAVMLMRLEPAAPQSRVKHSTTETLRSLCVFNESSVIIMSYYRQVRAAPEMDKGTARNLHA